MIPQLYCQITIPAGFWNIAEARYGTKRQVGLLWNCSNVIQRHCLWPLHLPVQYHMFRTVMPSLIFWNITIFTQNLCMNLTLKNQIMAISRQTFSKFAFDYCIHNQIQSKWHQYKFQIIILLSAETDPCWKNCSCGKFLLTLRPETFKRNINRYTTDECNTMEPGETRIMFRDNPPQMLPSIQAL